MASEFAGFTLNLTDKTEISCRGTDGRGRVVRQNAAPLAFYSARSRFYRKDQYDHSNDALNSWAIRIRVTHNDNTIERLTVAAANRRAHAERSVLVFSGPNILPRSYLPVRVVGNLLLNLAHSTGES